MPASNAAFTTASAVGWSSCAHQLPAALGARRRSWCRGRARRRTGRCGRACCSAWGQSPGGLAGIGQRHYDGQRTGVQPVANAKWTSASSVASCMPARHRVQQCVHGKQEQDGPLRHLPGVMDVFLLACASMAPLAQLFGVQAASWPASIMAAHRFRSTALAVSSAHDTDDHAPPARENDAEPHDRSSLSTTIVTIVMLVVVASRATAEGGALRPATPAHHRRRSSWAGSSTNLIFHYAYLFIYSEARAAAIIGGLEIPGPARTRLLGFRLFRLHAGHDLPDQRRTDHEPGDPARRAVPLPAAFVFNLGIIAFSINIIGGG